MSRKNNMSKRRKDHAALIEREKELKAKQDKKKEKHETKMAKKAVAAKKRPTLKKAKNATRKLHGVLRSKETEGLEKLAASRTLALKSKVKMSKTMQKRLKAKAAEKAAKAKEGDMDTDK